jgi:hypothetical protein
MSDATIQLSEKHATKTNRERSFALGKKSWWLVFTRELADLWIGGKALNLILIYSVVLGVMVYIFSFNSELSLIPPKRSSL